MNDERLRQLAQVRDAAQHKLDLAQQALRDAAVAAIRDDDDTFSRVRDLTGVTRVTLRKWVREADRSDTGLPGPGD